MLWKRACAEEGLSVLEGASNRRMLSSAERLLGVARPLTPLGWAGARPATESMAEGMFGGESAPALRPMMVSNEREDVSRELNRNVADDR